MCQNINTVAGDFQVWHLLLSLQIGQIDVHWAIHSRTKTRSQTPGLQDSNSPKELTCGVSQHPPSSSGELHGTALLTSKCARTDYKWAAFGPGDFALPSGGTVTLAWAMQCIKVCAKLWGQLYPGGRGMPKKEATWFQRPSWVIQTILILLSQQLLGSA